MELAIHLINRTPCALVYLSSESACRWTRVEHARMTVPATAIPVQAITSAMDDYAERACFA